MTETQLTTEYSGIERVSGAPSHQGSDWHNINWAKVNAQVRRLQARIVKGRAEIFCL